ncbi:MAG: TetR/AcrR family transcriptional regulator [Pseudomonadota bacterium]
MPGKQQRRPDDRPDEILDAATRVFAHMGFTAARMDDVAAQAGLSKGALYLYFKSKDALLDAIVTRFSDTVAAQLMDTLVQRARTDPVAAIEFLLEQGIAVATDPETTLVPRLVMSEAPRSPEIAALYRTKLLDTFEEAMAFVLNEGVRQGVFRQVRAASLMRALMGPILSHVLLTHVFTIPGSAALSPQVYLEDLKSILLDGLHLGEAA